MAEIRAAKIAPRLMSVSRARHFIPHGPLQRKLDEINDRLAAFWTATVLLLKIFNVTTEEGPTMWAHQTGFEARTICEFG